MTKLGRPRKYFGQSCSVEGCSRVAKNRGWCWAHSSRFYAHGSVNLPPKRDRCIHTPLRRKLLRTLRNIHYRCASANSCNFKWYGGKGIKNFLTIDDLEFMWHRDNAALMKRASIDRLDSNTHYVLNNCRFIEHSENVGNANASRRTKLHHNNLSNIEGNV